MRLNPSLTARLRIGFVVLFALLLAVSLLGVGRLFQIRVDYEDDTTRSSSSSSRPSACARPSSSSRRRCARPRPDPRRTPGRARQAAATSFTDAADRAADLTDDDRDPRVEPRRAGRRARPPGARRWPSPAAGREPGARRYSSGEPRRSPRAARRSARTPAGARDDARGEARDDTRDTTILVVGRARRGAARGAAAVLRADQLDARPLGRLVDGARRLAGGELETRVEVGGPVEIATLGRRVQRDGDRARTRRPRARPDRADEGRLRAHRLARAAHPGDGRQGLRRDADRAAESAERAPARGGRGDLRERRPAPEDDQRPARPGPQRRRQAAHRARADRGAPARPAHRPADAARTSRRRDQQLTVSVEKDLPEVQADPDRIGQVLANLLTNANKYAQEGADVRLSRERGRDRSSSPSPTTARASARRSWSTSSSASGGPRAARPRRSAAPASAWRSRSPWSSCTAGAITASSAPGEGATFRFVLPIADDGRPAPAARGFQAGAKDAAGAGK